MNDLKTVRDEILEADLNCKQVIIDILDRMIETPAPQGWSAIETAPKDGTEILLALWSGHPEHKTSFCWAINGHYKDGFFYSKDPMVGKLASPTHWQHITAPTPAPTDPSKFKYDRSDYVVLPPIRKNEDGSLTDSPTEKVKDFLAALDRLENDALSNRDGYGYSSGDAETIRRVLAENEKLRKERDELANGFKYLDDLHKELGIVDLTKETARCREIAKKVNENGNA